MENKAYKMYVNGEWIESSTGQYSNDINPYSGEVIATIASGGELEAKKAVDAAQAAFPAWSRFSPIERRKLLYRAAEIFDRRRGDFMEALALESGAATPFCKFQTSNGPEFFREAASQVFDVEGKIFPSQNPDTVSMMWRQPVGVVASISPWNAALLLALRGISFPLAYGNTVVHKPSEAAPLSGGLLIAEVLEEAGFPKGVFNVVTNGPGGSSQIGDVWTSDERVRRMTFTGSTEVGLRLTVQCAQHMKKICCELGGSCPLIVLDDADIDYAVNAATFGRFMHQGQVCMNSKRMIVEKGVAEEFIEKLAQRAAALKCGDPTDPETIIGPLINQNQVRKLQAQVEHAVEQGASMICGGKSDGLVYHPTVLVLTEDMDLAKEEAFGPVASVLIAEDAEDALRIANGTEFGLSGAVISKDVNKAWDLAQRLESGVVHINGSTLDDEPHAPLGGTKYSGWGKNGFLAIDEFTEARWATYNKKPRHFIF
ncbi:MAG: aldehyde dehydrogenase family protein [Oscillospiraceae bacterium]|nr:aldehyde dehydrogenase family protein [Oscillospiraceae bacterium]